MTDIFTDDDIPQAEGYPMLGPQYFAARRARIAAALDSAMLEKIAAMMEDKG